MSNGVYILKHFPLYGQIRGPLKKIILDSYLYGVPYQGILHSIVPPVVWAISIIDKVIFDRHLYARLTMEYTFYSSPGYMGKILLTAAAVF